MTEQIMTRITQEVELVLGEGGHWYVMIMVKVTHYREPVTGRGTLEGIFEAIRQGVTLGRLR